MKRRTIIILVTAGLSVFVALGVLRAIQRDRIHFGRYLVKPIPNSVAQIQIESNDWFGLMPEPDVRISFSATSQDLAGIIAKGGFAKASGDAANWFESRGDRGWWSAVPLDDGSRLFVRSGRRGEEYIRIDKSGTNAFYLLWGI